jgi:hypothetical protein
VSLSSDVHTGTPDSDGEYDSEHDSDVAIPLESNVEAPDGIDLDGDVDMEKDGDDEREEDEEMKQEGKEDEEEVEDEEEEDKDENDGKEPWMIGQGEMVNTSADNVDTMVANQPILLSEQGQEMRKHTPQLEPLASAAWRQTPDPQPSSRQTLETHLVSGLEHFGLGMPQNPGPAVPTLQEAEVARNTLDMDVNQQVARVSPMLLSLMSLSQIPLSPMSLSLRHTWLAGQARSEPVVMLQRRRWLLRSHSSRVLVLFVSFVLI